MFLIGSQSHHDLANKLGLNKVTISAWKADNSYPVWLDDYLRGQIAIKKLDSLKNIFSSI